jgi:hypothetical protein
MRVPPDQSSTPAESRRNAATYGWRRSWSVTRLRRVLKTNDSTRAKQFCSA